MAGKEKIRNFAQRQRIADDAEELFDKVERGFKEEKKDQVDNNTDYWKIYNCQMTDMQIYDGDSQCFVPAVKDCVDARRKRFTTMLFPSAGKNLEVISESGDTPYDTIALLQHHIKFARVRNKLPPIFINGDVEGQWSFMVDWVRRERKVTRKVNDNIPGTDFEWEDVKSETVVEEGPEITLIPSNDLFVWPATVEHIQDAELVAVKFRWTKEKLKQKAREGWLLEDAVEDMIDGGTMDAGDKWSAKQRAKDAGIDVKSQNKFECVYMIYTKMKLDGPKKEPAIVFLGEKKEVLGVVANPYWSKKINIISHAADPVGGSFWGSPKIMSVADLQYQLNDVVNMGLDSALFALLPIVMTDPLKNPRVASMIMGKAAIWETSPNDTKIVNFPQLYQHSLTLKQDLKAQIAESMEVNDAMLGKAPAGRKNAQAIGQQQQEGLATINDVVKRFETGPCDEMLEWFYELDLQFREDDLLAVRFGEHGQRTTMERIPVQQWKERYHFHWTGTDQLAGPQRIQQLISGINVFRGLPPNVLNGRKLDLGPAIDQLAELMFGPTLSGQILIDQRHQWTIDPVIENEMLANGFDIPVSPYDDQQKHLQMHEQAAHATQDRTGAFRRHIMQHIQAMQAQIQQQNPQPQGQPGSPGAQGQPGIAGLPRQGAAPAPQRGAQQAPGAIPHAQMADGAAGMMG